MAEKKIPNVAEVRRKARDDWERRQRKRQSRIEKISRTIDFWIVLFVLSFVALSVPHTVRVFNLITPVWGTLAFIGLELGLLYRSFRGKIAIKRDEPLPVSLRGLAWLLFVTLILANGVGAFIAVAEHHEALSGLSLAALFKAWPDLPAQSQLALILVPIAAILIPVGTIAGGEGLAALFLDAREEGDPLDELWAGVARDVEYLALRDAMIAMDNTPARSKKWAAEVVDRPVAPVQNQRTTDTSGQADSVTDARTEQRTADKRSNGRNPRAKQDALDWLEEHGDPGVTIRELAELVGVKRTPAHEALNEYKARRNGHDS